MIGRKEKKRWTQLAEFFEELQSTVKVWNLSQEPLLFFEDPEGSEVAEVEEQAPDEEVVREEKPAVVQAEAESESTAETESEVAEEAAEAEPSSKEAEDAEEEPKVGEVVEEVVTELDTQPATLDRQLPASLFFSQLDWSGQGEAAASIARLEQALPALRTVSGAAPVGESASTYFSSIPWDGQSNFEPARLHSQRGLGKLMETATQQALKTAQSRATVIPINHKLAARAYFSQAPWQKAAN